MHKLAAVFSTVLISLGLRAFLPAQPPSPDDGPPPHKAKGKDKAKEKEKGKDAAKKKGEAGPKGDLRKAYDLLRRLRADETSAGRPEERIRDWTERAARCSRDGLKGARRGGRVPGPRVRGRRPRPGTRRRPRPQRRLFDRRDPDLPPRPTRSDPTTRANGPAATFAMPMTGSRSRAAEKRGRGPNSR